MLSFYDTWNLRSRGPYNGHLGALIAAWKAAETADAPPHPATLRPIVRALALPGWKLDATTHIAYGPSTP